MSNENSSRAANHAPRHGPHPARASGKKSKRYATPDASLRAKKNLPPAPTKATRTEASRSADAQKTRQNLDQAFQNAQETSPPPPAESDGEKYFSEQQINSLSRASISNAVLSESTKTSRIRVGHWNNKTFTWIETVDPNMKLPEPGNSFGKIKEVRGKWGFIRDHSCPSYDLFFHMSEVADGRKGRLRKGAAVEYRIEKDQWRNERKSKFKAVSVCEKSDHTPSRSMQSKNWREQMLTAPHLRSKYNGSEKNKREDKKTRTDFLVSAKGRSMSLKLESNQADQQTP